MKTLQECHLIVNHFWSRSTLTKYFGMCRIKRCLIISNLMTSELEIPMFFLSCISISRSLQKFSILRLTVRPGLETYWNKSRIPKWIGYIWGKIIFTRKIKIFACPAAWSTRKYERTSAVFEPTFGFCHCSLPLHLKCWHTNGSVVECLTLDRGAAGSSLTGVTALWSLNKTHLP